MKYKKKVTKQEFEEFISSYPAKLDIDVAGMFEPALKTYNDFSTGLIWPYSVVAFTKLSDEPKDYFIYVSKKEKLKRK